MRKVWGTFLLAALSLTLSACGNMASTESDESAKITSGSAIQVSDPRKDALQAYYDILSQEKYQNEDAECMKTYFAISDLNTDGIPELLIHSSANVMDFEQYYTYENGTAIQLEGFDGEGYCRSIGKLYTLPSRNTYAFFLEGPSGNKDDGNFYQCFELSEYAIENQQIHKINTVCWEICKSDEQTDNLDCSWNDQKCSLDKIMDEYQLEKTKDEDYGYIHCDLPSQEDNYIKFLPNTDANRKAVCTDSNPAVYALNAYYDFLSLVQYQNNDDEDKIMGTHFAISDLNADGIPELLISEDFNELSISEYYTYENGTVTEIKGPCEGEGYPQAGSLYTLPHRASYAFFRGGPLWTEAEDGNSYMPYILVEYTLDMEKHQIGVINGARWDECNSGKSWDIAECKLNEKKCSIEELIDQYSMKRVRTDEDLPLYRFPEENYIELLPNTDDNRKTIIAESVSDSDTNDTESESESVESNTSQEDTDLN